MAKKRLDQLNQQLKARRLRQELDFNCMFDEAGSVKGLGVVVSARRGILLKMQLNHNGKQIGNTRTLSNRDLRDAYNELVQWRMDKLVIKPNVEIKRQLVESYKIFEATYKSKLAKVEGV